MASELAPEHIPVNALAPGPVETPLVKAMQDDAVRAAGIREIPQRREPTSMAAFAAAGFLPDRP